MRNISNYQKPDIATSQQATCLKSVLKTIWPEFLVKIEKLSKNVHNQMPVLKVENSKIEKKQFSPALAMVREGLCSWQMEFITKIKLSQQQALANAHKFNRKLLEDCLSCINKHLVLVLKTK